MNTDSFKAEMPLGNQVCFLILGVLEQSITLVSFVSETNVGSCGIQHTPVQSSIFVKRNTDVMGTGTKWNSLLKLHVRPAVGEADKAAGDGG